MPTRKLLVALDPSNPRAGSGEFLVPVVRDGAPRLVGLKRARPANRGMMVYVGRDVTTDDLLDRLLSSGVAIDAADQARRVIESYLRKLQDHKVGSVVGIEPAPGEPGGFRLTKVAASPGGPRPPLP